MNRHACTIIYSMYRLTELMLSVHRADCERATQPYSSGGGGVRFFQAQDQPSVTTHVRLGNPVFSHSLDVVSKMYIHIIYSFFFTCSTVSETLFKLITHCFVVSSNVLNFHGHSQCPCINVARLSVLHYDTVAHVVNIPGRSMSTG